MPPHLPRRRTHLVIALSLIVLGVLWRTAPLHLPPFAYKWGGSALWAAMVYSLTAAALPRTRPLRAAAIACLIATLVELSRLFHTPALDAFRHTLAGKLLLGRIFSLRDIAVYWAVILLAAWLDSTHRQRPFPLRNV